MMNDLELKSFFEVMISNLSVYFKNHYKQVFTNQTINTCLSIFKLCKETNPDYVVEIGTNHGASTFAIILALKSLGKKLSCVTSIDLDHLKWEESFTIQKNLIEKYCLEIDKIKTITSDFNTVDPSNLLDKSGKFFIFYDMHDHKGPWSQRLLDLWVPQIDEGVFAVHDITPVDETYEIEMDDLSPRSKALYNKNNQYFAGFKECARIINWANLNDVELFTFDGGIYFNA